MLLEMTDLFGSLKNFLENKNEKEQPYLDL